MNKIPTIFDRDWDGNRGVVDSHIVSQETLAECIATEKLDGMNVRITVRSSRIVRLEKRRNPSKIQKKLGITEPWYVDADPNDPADKYLFKASEMIKIANTEDVPDGEWSCEALGPKIQGNPLGFEERFVLPFSLGHAPSIQDAPITFDELKEWLPQQKSALGRGSIEGIVWHHPDGRMFKIKTKDFK